MIVPSSWRGWLSEEGLHTSVIRTESLSAGDISRFCDHARRAFYLRPGFMLSTAVRALRDSDERTRTLKAFSSFWRFLLPKRSL